MSHMSKDFVAREGSVPDQGLVALGVHPSDHERLKALSGIWPVSDTITRLIDVFIATGAASASQSLRSMPAAEVKSLPEDVPSARVRKETASACEGQEKVVGKTAPKAAKRRSTRAVLAFDRTDFPDLAFSRLEEFAFGDAKKSGADANWSRLFEEAVGQLLAAGHGIGKLEEFGIRARNGKNCEKGLRWVKDLGISLCRLSSMAVFNRVLMISDLLQVPVRIRLSWDEMPASRLSGRTAVISSEPMPFVERRCKGVRRPTMRGVPGEVTFPHPGSIVSFIYADRREEERLIHLVEGPANPTAGQISVSSPLGRALLETPCGGTGRILLKGQERQIRVLEVTA